MTEGPAQPVTIGRIVHYVLPEGHPRAGEHRPAIVVRVIQPWDAPNNPGMSNLQVLLDGPNEQPPDQPRAAPFPTAMWVGSVLYSAEHRPGTWHWPPRA